MIPLEARERWVECVWCGKPLDLDGDDAVETDDGEWAHGECIDEGRKEWGDCPECGASLKTWSGLACCAEAQWEEARKDVAAKTYRGLRQLPVEEGE